MASIAWTERKPPVGAPGYVFPADWAHEFCDEYAGAVPGLCHELVSVDCGRAGGPDGYIGLVEE